MGNESEVMRGDEDTQAIRQQMDETRSALTDKLGRLEQQVVDTVQGAVGQVENVKNAVESTVQNVKDTVRETVESVQDTLDLRKQVDRHPWTMMAGACAVGYIGGMLCCSSDDSPSSHGMRNLTRSGQRHNGRWHEDQEMHEEGGSFQRSSGGAGTAFRSTSSGSDGSSRSSGSWLAGQSEWLQPALNQLKGLAVGASLGLVRDMVTNSVSGPLGSQVADILNDMTRSLGAEPIKGRILPERKQGGMQGQQGHSSQYPDDTAYRPQSQADELPGGSYAPTGSSFRSPAQTADI